MNNKTMKIVCIVLAAVMVVSAVVFAVSAVMKNGNDNADNTPEQSTAAPEPVEFSATKSEYATKVSVKGANGEIFLPTDFENIYYTATLGGDVKFYEYSGGSFSESKLAPKEVKTSIKASRISIPVTVKYIEKDGKVCGYGVVTSETNPDMEVYAYAFVKLTMKPSGYGSGHLLLADFDKNSFYKADKVYSEIYNFNLSKGTASAYVSNHTRMVDINGTFRQDWSMLTDEFAANLGGAKYFISSRFYNESEKGERADIMVLSNAYQPKVVAKDILGMWFVNDANGMHYLKKDGEGFINVINSGKGEEELTRFEGDWSTDYLQYKNYLLNKESLVMFDLLKGTSVTLSGIKVQNADYFTLSPDGKKAVFVTCGKENANGTLIQSVTFCTVDGSAEPVTYKEPMLFSESTGFIWLDNSNVMSVRAINEDGTKAGSVVYTY